ncbi:MAG TPA: Yip1 family protein [Thermoanaerobaculia bacterium]|nr:Yip1 family protein [Thermoanaerobaculia bacterium]
MSDPIQPAGPPSGPAGAGWPEEPSSDSPGARVSAANRIWKVLVAPRETFQSIAAHPSWGLLFVVTVLVSIAAWYLLAQKIDFAESLRQQFEQQGRDVPSGTAEKMAGVTKIITLVGAGIAPMVLVLLMALVYMAFNLFGGRLRYVTSVSVVLHAGVPNLLKLLLSLPVAMSRDSILLEEAQMGLLKSNLAAFAPENAGRQLYLLLASFDVFALWSLFLLIVGFSAAARVSRAKASAFVLVFWAALILLFVALAGLRPS